LPHPEPTDNYLPHNSKHTTIDIINFCSVTSDQFVVVVSSLKQYSNQMLCGDIFDIKVKKCAAVFVVQSSHQTDSI